MSDSDQEDTQAEQVQYQVPSLLHHILLNVVGMKQIQVNKLADQGINTVEDMTLIGQEDILSIFRTRTDALTAMMKSKLKAFMEWIQYQEQIHGAGHYKLEDFDENECATWQRRVNIKRKHEDRSKASKKDALKMPATFDGKQQSWLKA